MKIINISFFLLFFSSTIFAQKINNSFFGGRLSFYRESIFYDTVSSIRNSNQTGYLYDTYSRPIYSKNTNTLRFHPVWTRKTEKGNFKEWELTKLYFSNNNLKYQVKSDNILPDSLIIGNAKFRNYGIVITNRTYWNLIKKYSSKFALNLVFSKSLEFDNYNNKYNPENLFHFSDKAYAFRSKIGASFGIFFIPKKHLIIGLNSPEYFSLDVGLGRRYVYNYQVPAPLRGQTMFDFNIGILPILTKQKIQKYLNFPAITFAYSF
jgi:hypothetical protein